MNWLNANLMLFTDQHREVCEEKHQQKLELHRVQREVIEKKEQLSHCKRKLERAEQDLIMKKQRLDLLSSDSILQWLWLYNDCFKRLLNCYDFCQYLRLWCSENLELMKIVFQRYKSSEVVQENAMDIFVKCFRNLESKWSCLHTTLWQLGIIWGHYVSRIISTSAEW